MILTTPKMAQPALMKLSKVAAFLNSVERNSASSKKAYFNGLLHLENFILRNYPEYNPETILQRLLKNRINVYEFLDNFVAYLLRQERELHLNLLHCMLLL